MQKILIITGIYEPEIGGPASYAKALASYLVSDHEVTIVTYSSVMSHPADRLATYRVIRVARAWPRLIRHIIYIAQVIRVARTTDTILALSAMNAGLAGLIASRIFKKKLVIRVVGDYAWERSTNKGTTNLSIDEFQRSQKRGFASIFHKIQVYVCQHASQIIVPSKYLAKLVQRWGVDQTKIAIISNGVESLLSDDRREDARKHIGISGNIILSVGRLVPWKGFRMLIKIMPILLQTNQFTRLVIVGEGPDRASLTAMIQNMGLEKKVYLAGKKSHDELKTYFAAADMFVLNTGYEGFSHQILEAMSAGIPVITTDIGGNPEIVTQGKNGFLIRYNDEFNLIEAIKTLWNSEKMRDQFIIEGHKTAAQFSIKKMAEQTKALLAKLVLPA